MAILKRINKYQGLKDIDVLVEESGLSSQYFNIYDVPSNIPQGRSSFLLAGSPFLKNFVELKVEILDSAGKTVYSEPVANYLEGNARRISVEVYDDTAPGDGFLYIVGELRDNFRSVSGQQQQNIDITDKFLDPETLKNLGGNDIPGEFKNVYNVRYIRPIFINTTIPNTEPIFFYQQPRVTVSEILKGYVIETTVSSSYEITGSVSVEPIQGLGIQDPEPDPIDGFSIGMKDGARDSVGAELEIFKNRRKNKIDPLRNNRFSKSGRITRRESPEIDRFTINVTDMETSPENTTSDAVTSAFVGGEITINNPIVDSEVYPSDEYTIPSQYKSSIKKVNNENTLVPLDDFLITKKDTGEKIPVKIEEASNNVTMSVLPTPPQTISTTHYRSYADIIVGNLHTFSGDVYSAKVYARSKGTLGDFEPVYDASIEAPQVLIDSYSPTGFKNTGYFYTQSIVDDYWDVVNGTATQNNSKFIDGVLLSGSNQGFTPKDSTTNTVEFNTSHSYSLETSVPYTVEFNAYYYKEDKSDEDGVSTKQAELEVYLSGSAITGGTEDDHKLGKVVVGENQIEGQILGVHNTFTSATSGTPSTHLKFKATAGRWIIQDILLRPHAETNFNPTYFRTIVPMEHPLPKKPDQYDFLVEFYDLNNNIAETISVKEDIDFVGAPQNIDGENNLLSGSLFIGNAQGSGFEMAGASSAYIRSLTYEGFDKTIASSSGGFMMWSGSVGARLSSSEDYEGVGLEIVDAHGATDRYLQFKTNPSTFKVQTDEFYLGSDSQFVSGSNGNIEISSSNFHLQPDGDVVMSGTITATAGNIGDWTIAGGDIVGSNITLDADGSRIYKTDDNAELTGYYMDFTPGSNYYIRFGTNFAVSSSGTLIAEGAIIEGVLTSSEGLIANWTIAPNSIHKLTSGTYSGLSSTGDTRFFGGASSLTATGSAPFNVKSNGDITGSSVLFTGGDIAGWNINGNTLQGGTGGTIRLNASNQKITINSHTFGNEGIQMDYNGGDPRFYVGDGSNNYMKYDGSGVDIKTQKFVLDTANFDVTATGQITGSQVLFTGGQIGGWTINSTNFASLGDAGIRLNANGDNAEISINTHTYGGEGIQLGYNGGDPRMYVGDGAQNFLKYDTNDGVSVKTTRFELDTSDLELSSTHASMSLGSSQEIVIKGNSSSPYISVGQSTVAYGEIGIILAVAGGTTPLFSAVGSTGHIKFNGSSLDINTTILELDASNIEISSTHASMSLGEGKILLDGSNDLIRVGSNASNNVKVVGTATQGYIHTGKTSATSTTSGFWLANNNGDPEFHVGNSTDFLKFDGGDLNITSQNLEISSSTLQMSTAQASMSLGHTVANPYGKIIVEGKGTPTFRVGPDAHFISMTTGSGIYMDGDGAFKFGDADGNVSFDGTSFTITGSDVDINVTDLNITATGFKLSSTQASMSLGTNEQWFVEANGTSPYMSLGQSTKAYGNAGVFIGYVNSVSRPKVSFVGSTGHFKIDQDVDIKTETFELDANSGDLQISSAHKSMSLNDGTIILDGPNKKITVGTSNAVTIQGGGNGGVDNYIVMGSKADFSDYDKSTQGIIMGMDTSVPKFEMAKNSTNYLRWDTTSGLDLATEAMEVSASNIQISSAQASMSIGPSQTNPIVLQSLGNDRYLKFGSKTDFDQASTAGFIMGIDNGTPKFDFTISATNYLRVDGSNVDIKTPNFKLDTATLDIDSTTRRIQVFDTGSGERVRIGEISDSASDLYGFKIYDGSGTGDSNTLVKLGQEGNRIAGWTINQTSLFSNNIFIHSEGSIETADFVSNEKGWRISADGNGTAEFENVRIRGTLSTAVFEKESVNAVGGQLYIANSTAITGSFVSASHATMSVVNSTGFTGSYSNDFGEILTAKKVDSTGFQTEYMLVRSASRDFPDSEDNFAGKLYVERAWGSGSSGEFVGDLASTSQSYEPGQVIVSTGLSGSGYIRLNANPKDTSTPYMDIVERTGSGIYDVEHKVRVGDLSGLSAGKLYGETNPGFGLYGENVFLSGSITATSGSIKGRMHITTSPSEEILLGTNVNGTDDGIYINNNNYWFTDSTFKVGSANYYLQNDASGNITIHPKTFELDADTGELQISSTQHSMSFNDDDILIHAKDSGGSHIRVGRNVDRAIIISGSQAHGAIYSGKTNVGSTTAGFWLANNNTDPEFHLGNSTNFMKYDANALSMTTQTFELNAGTGDLQISSAETSMSLGDRSVILAKSGSGGGYAQFGQDITKAIQISGSSTQGTIRSVKDSLADNTAGFWLSNHNGTQEFFVGTATEHIKFDGSNMSLAGNNLSLTAATVDVTTGTIKVDADDFQINSTVPSMSLGYDTNVNAGMTIVGGSPSRIGFGPKSSYNMELASTTTDDYLTVGGKTWGGTDDGIIIGSDGGVYKLEMYADADNYFTYASTGVVDIRTDTFDLQGTNMALNNTRMYLGTITSDSDSTGVGVYMDNGGAFRVFGNSTNYLTVDAGSMAIATDDFSLDTAKGDIIFNSLVQRISMGASPPTTFTANGIILSGSGYFNLQKDQYNYIRHDASGLGLASQELNVSGSTTFRLHGNSTGSKIRLGASADDITATANTGIYMDSTGKFRVGTATSGTSYIHYDSTLDIKTPSFKLDTANLDIDSAAGGSGSIALGATPPTQYDSGAGFFVDGAGNLLLGNSAANHIKYKASTGGLDVVGTITISNFDSTYGSAISGSITGATGSLDTAITSAQNQADLGVSGSTAAQNTANTAESNAQTGISGSSAAQNTANTATSAASTAQSAIDTMETQVVLSNDGMALWGVSGSPGSSAADIKVAEFGTTTTFWDGTGHTDAHRKLQLNSDGVYTFGDDTDTYTYVRAAGVQVVSSSVEVADFGATTTIGNTSYEHVEITNSSLKLKDSTTDLVSISGTTVVIGSDSDNRVTITPSSMQIGSTGGGITMDSDGDATFHGTITITGPQISSLTGSLDSSITNAQNTANTATTIANTVAGVTASLANETTFTPTSAAGTGNGLHLGSDKLGFIDSSTWKTYMDNSGNFYLGGTSGALTWTAGTSTLNVNRITATTGTIGDFDIGSSTLESVNNKLILDGSGNGKIRLGAVPPASATSGTGIFLGGDGTFLAGSSSGNRIQYTSSGAIVLQSNTFALRTSTVNIDSGVNSGTLRLGASGGPTSNELNQQKAGVYMDGTGDFFVSDGDAGTAEGYLKFDASAGTFELKTAALTFETDGTITSQNYLVERSRIFGTGTDGDVTLTTGTAQTTIAQTYDSHASTAHLWTLIRDAYTDDLTINSGVTLKTGGYRLFVKGTLTNNGTISNDGAAGGNGGTRTNPGTPGRGGDGVTLSDGTDGVVGGLGGLGDSQSGAAGGGSGGSGGIVFISARIIVNNGTIQALGGAGGDGGNGGSAVP